MRISEASSSNATQSVTRQQGQVEGSQQKRSANQQNVKQEIEDRQQDAQDGNLDRDQLEQEIEKLNDTVQTFHEHLSFELHETSELLMVQLVDLSQNEVIKEMPPEDMLDTIGHIRETIGMIVDEMV